MNKNIPSPPILYCLSDIPGSRSYTAQAQKNIAAFAKEGISFVSADTGLHLGWHKIAPFDPEPLRAEIAGVLDANPDARIYLRLHVNPPYWWIRDHVEEQIVYRDKGGDHYGVDEGESDRLIRWDGEHRVMRCSLASELWKKEAGEILALFLDSLTGTREGEALAGIQIASGMFGEWHNWGTDVGKPAVARFRRYLEEKYKTTDALRAAWNDPGVTFETAGYHPEHYRPGDDGNFRDPRKSRFVMDAQECMQISIAETIIHFCRIAKEHRPDTMVGAFCGYYLGTSPYLGAHNAVELIRKAHDEGVIDFHCGPFCYMENRKPDAVPLQRALIESSRLHGMLWLTEMDQHPEGLEYHRTGDPAKFWETVSVLRRNTFQTLLAGEGFWYYDHRIVPGLKIAGSELSEAGSIYRKSGWWDNPLLMHEIRKIQDVAVKYCSGDLTEKRTCADVLFVCDTHSYYCRFNPQDKQYPTHEAIVRSGVVYDLIYADDLPIAELDRYKCVIFSNVCLMTKERREQFRALTEGKTRVWLYAEGFCDDVTLDEANVSATVGMEVRRTSGQSSYTFGNETVEFGEASYSPQFAAVEAEDLEVLGRYPDGSIAAAKRGKDVWFAAPQLTASIMRSVFTAAGVNIWVTSGEPVMAGCGLVLLNSPKGGRRTLHLPDGRTITDELPPWTTAVYDMTTEERVL